MNAEEWRPVVGFEGRYEVSNRGRVRSLDQYIRCGYESKGVRLHSGRILNASLSNHGYFTVNLGNGIRGQGVHRLVHRIVAEAFIQPQPSPEHGINHRDGIKTNNRVSNLEWTTGAENMRHAQRMGLMLKGEAVSNSKLTNEQVQEIRSLRKEGISLQEIAGRFGMAESTVCQICRGRVWKHLLPDQAKVPATWQDIPTIKLTEDEVIAIRREYATGNVSQSQLAQKYGVNPTNISQIVLRKTWKHITEQDGSDE